MAAFGLTTVLAAGCGSTVEAVDARETPGRAQTISTATTRHTTSVSAQSTDLVEDQMEIVITLGEKRFGAVLTDSAALLRPRHDLVLYYGDQSYYPGIVVLGRLDSGSAAEIADQRGPVTAIVEAR